MELAELGLLFVLLAVVPALLLGVIGLYFIAFADRIARNRLAKMQRLGIMVDPEGAMFQPRMAIYQGLVLIGIGLALSFIVPAIMYLAQAIGPVMPAPAVP